MGIFDIFISNNVKSSRKNKLFLETRKEIVEKFQKKYQIALGIAIIAWLMHQNLKLSRTSPCCAASWGFKAFALYLCFTLRPAIFNSASRRGALAQGVWGHSVFILFAKLRFYFHICKKFRGSLWKCLEGLLDEVNFYVIFESVRRRLQWLRLQKLQFSAEGV